jgi:hypothetical protein
MLLHQHLWFQIQSRSLSFLQSAYAVLNNDGHVHIQHGSNWRPHLVFKRTTPSRKESPTISICFPIPNVNDSIGSSWSPHHQTMPGWMEQTMANPSFLCEMSAVRETMDPLTGYDSLRGKTFPFWITCGRIFTN